jgi:putative spermidine/putrescine transport system substrate-binding protein
MYNTKTFPTPPDSWSVVFVTNLPDGKTNQGRVQAYDGPIYIADAALFVKATQPQLGIKDPYQLTEEQYAVLKVLRDQHALIHRYWHDTTVQMSDFKNEGVVASSAWPYQANALKARTSHCHRLPERGGDRLGGYHHAARAGKTPDVRLQMDELVADAESAGRSGGMVWLAAGGAEGCKASTLLGAAKPTAITSSTKSCSGKRRLQKAANCPYSRWTQDYIAIMGGR